MISDPSVFLSATCFITLIGFVVKVDKYETNRILNIADRHTKLEIKPESYKKLKIKEDDFFTYYLDGVEITHRVLWTGKQNTHWEVILSGQHRTPNPIITYKIGQGSLWSEVFG